MQIDEAKTAFNARVKREMDMVLRAKSWVEKVKSIERMNAADKSAKSAMRDALRGRISTNEGRVVSLRGW